MEYRFRKTRCGNSGAFTAWMVVVALALLGADIPAHADLIIAPTFDASLNGPEQAAINAAITAVEAGVSSPNNITVDIYFNTANTGLGTNVTGDYNVSWFDYYNAFQTVATSASQLTALASLGLAPANSNSVNPVNGGTEMSITSAEARNLGFNAPGFVAQGNGTYDSVISLNTSITAPPNTLTGNYALQAVATHEIDEVLGVGGQGTTLGVQTVCDCGELNADTGTGPTPTLNADGGSGGPGAIGDLDLYRYSAPGVRSDSEVDFIGPYAYFSIDGGNTVLSYFNQDSSADFGDWYSSNPFPTDFSPQVQDAFATPGTDPVLGANEFASFSAIGYEVNSSAMPEPSTLPLIGMGLGLVYIFVRRNRAVE